MPHSSDIFYLGDWLVNPALHRLSRNGRTKKLEPQLMSVLVHLSKKPGEVVKKQDLLNLVWSDVVVTENALARAISSLRKELEDNPNNPKYIETISKTGYRLIASVKSKNGIRKKETFTHHIAKKPAVVGITLVIFILLGAFAVRQIFLPTTSGKVYDPMAIANHSNSEYWPAISPDGKFVAYSWRGHRDNNWDIYARLIGGESPIRITSNPLSDLRARWSPFGDHIYYLRYEQGGSTIYKKPLMGDEEVRIMRSPEYSHGDFDISPDEKWISYNDRKYRTSPLQLKLLSLETNEEIWLTQPALGTNGDIHPTFSPDGSKIAFIREKNASSMHLWLYDLNSEELTQLTEDNVSINGFDWSRDGQSLFYASDKTGLYKLWELTLGTLKSSMVPAGDYQMVMPRVAETGRMIYAKMTDNVDIWTYKPRLKTSEPWLTSNRLSLNPSVSPQGDKVCFTMIKNSKFQIWVADIDASNAIPITRFAGDHINAPRWLRNGETIVFQGYVGGQADIFTVNAIGGIPVNLTGSQVDEHTPYAGKEKIYYSSNQDGDWAIRRMEFDGTNDEPVISGGAYAPQIRSDEKAIYYIKKGDFGLWEYDLATNTERIIIKEFDPKHWGAFSVTDQGAYYLNIENRAIEFYDFESSLSASVLQLSAMIPRMGIALNYSTVNDQLIFCQISHHDSDIMLLNEQ